MPRKISSGVMRKPPPTPKIPERVPTPIPNPRITNTFTDNSAIGRYRNIEAAVSPGPIR
jgi:hypothetical protein